MVNMANYVRLDRTYLFIALAILVILLVGGFAWARAPLSGVAPVEAASEPGIHGEAGGEQYRNYQLYDYNYSADCYGKNNLNRRLNPHLYTFRQKPWNRQFPFYNYYNSPQIIGCGARRAPCDIRGAIPNVLDPIDVSNRNIAPNTVFVDDNLDMKLQKVGAVYKVYGNENQVFPLYGRSLYHNDNKWEYFVRMGPTGEFLRVLTPHQYEELGNNDEVKVEGRCGVYRVSIYDRFLPQYVPFI